MHRSPRCAVLSDACVACVNSLRVRALQSLKKVGEGDFFARFTYKVHSPTKMHHMM